MEEFETKKNLLSDFNEAKFQIMRLHNSWCLCNNYKRQGKLEDLKWELDNVWDELAAKAFQKYSNNKTALEIKLIDVKIAKAKNETEKYNALRDKYRKLKLIQEDVGMGGRMSDNDRDAMDD